MSILRIDFRPSHRQLAVFGVTWLVFFGALGGLALHRAGSLTAAIVLWTLAAAVPAIGWIAPPFLRIVYVGMACAAFPIGWVVAHLTLGGVYYLVVTPTGLLLRAFGHDPMSRRPDPDADTYWVPRPPDEDVNRYFRQF